MHCNPQLTYESQFLPGNQGVWGEQGFCKKCGHFIAIHYDTRFCVECTGIIKFLGSKLNVQ